MSCLITGSLMNGIMDGIQILLFSSLCQLGLALCCAVLSLNTELQILLCRIRYNFAEHLCELCGMDSFLRSSLLIIHTDFRISLTISYACHSHIHAHLCALTGEVSLQSLFDISRNIRSDADLVLGSPYLCSAFLKFNKFGLRLMTCRAGPGIRKILKLYAFYILIINVTADCAFVLSHNKNPAFLPSRFRTGDSL